MTRYELTRQTSSTSLTTLSPQATSSSSHSPPPSYSVDIEAQLDGPALKETETMDADSTDVDDELKDAQHEQSIDTRGLSGSNLWCIQVSHSMPHLLKTRAHY